MTIRVVILAASCASQLCAARAVGLQLYSLRVLAKSNPGAALDQARDWGFSIVETAGTAGVPAREFRRLLDARGLSAASMHVTYERLQKEPEAVVRDAKVLGAGYVICPFIPHKSGRFDAAAAGAAAADFNRWGRMLREKGLKFGYHPHGFEFDRLPGAGGDRVFDVLAAATRPDDVCFEMDVFWVYHAGVDPVSLLRRYAGRWQLLHLKDIRRGAPRVPAHGVRGSSAPAEDRVALGDGEIDWPAVLSAAERQGAYLYFIEDESPDPMRCIPESLGYLNSLR